jgi:hypothetical protein
MHPEGDRWHEADAAGVEVETARTELLLAKTPEQRRVARERLVAALQRLRQATAGIRVPPHKY